MLRLTLGGVDGAANECARVRRAWLLRVFEIPERVHPCLPFAEVGKQTPVFVRFSTVLGERGSTDTARDVLGFAVKFYTDEGNWDLVGTTSACWSSRTP